MTAGGAVLLDRWFALAHRATTLRVRSTLFSGNRASSRGGELLSLVWAAVSDGVQVPLL